MTDREFEEICIKIFKEHQNRVPYTPESGTFRKGKQTEARYHRASTGNMRYNATRKKFIRTDVFEFGTYDDVAPYVVYTNEPWKSPKWKDAKNPNEQWFQDSVHLICQELMEIRD